jgi:TetR/AcrR family transcriptional repressor of nem operon
MSRTQTARLRRDRLVTSAARLIHQRGVAHTTLTDIAREAEVAPGSVYYFFKTKEDILQSIVEKRLADLEQSLDKAGGARSPARRLEALVQIWVDDKEIDTLYGCPFGSLCYEIAKGRGPLSDVVSQPLRVLLQWAEQQFRQLGRGRKSPDLALHLVAALQGISLVANALGDADLIIREARQLKSWIKQVASSGAAREAQ